MLDALRPGWAIGVGKYAEGCLLNVATEDIRIGTVLHPSPASPAANRDWPGMALKQLQALGVWT